MTQTLTHRHGDRVHAHPFESPHRHRWLWRESAIADHEHHDHDRVHADHADHAHAHGHGHTHGRIDPSIIRSSDGVRTVSISLVVLAVTAMAQTFVFVWSGSVALLADLVHNAGDALTAIPLAAAFLARSQRAEQRSGYFVVGVIVVSAVVAAFESIERLVHPRPLTHLVAVGLAGAIGFIGNEIAAQIRLNGGTRLNSAALKADGHHARVDGYVSLGVVGSAVVVALGVPRADPLIGLAITAVILRVTVQAWRELRPHR